MDIQRCDTPGKDLPLLRLLLTEYDQSCTWKQHAVPEADVLSCWFCQCCTRRQCIGPEDRYWAVAVLLEVTPRSTALLSRCPSMSALLWEDAEEITPIVSALLRLAWWRGRCPRLTAWSEVGYGGIKWWWRGELHVDWASSVGVVFLHQLQRHAGAASSWSGRILSWRPLVWRCVQTRWMEVVRRWSLSPRQPSGHQRTDRNQSSRAIRAHEQFFFPFLSFSRVEPIRSVLW
jgi:hypothetical protein